MKASPVVCNLIHVKLSECPVYEALSYQWGPENVMRDIEIHGHPWHVRENLYWALSHLRYREGCRLLWIDALCINQMDNVERGHQVYQMGMIYSHAERVCVWLGLADDSAHGTHRLLHRESTWDELKSGLLTRLNEWRHLACLCEKEYWDRLWIIQEVVLAGKIEVHCGHLNFPWEKLSEAVSSLHGDIKGLYYDHPPILLKYVAFILRGYQTKHNFRAVRTAKTTSRTRQPAHTIAVRAFETIPKSSMCRCAGQDFRFAQFRSCLL
jgi:hypothetical protein